jgi:hypothetical protein
MSEADPVRLAKDSMANATAATIPAVTARLR